MDGLNIERIKAYNKELKEYKEKSANARAQLEVNKNELLRLCNELTTELNIQVTPDNIEEVYKQCVEKIENNLKTGEEILQRIKNEESANSITSEQTTTNVGTPAGNMVGFDSLGNTNSNESNDTVGIGFSSLPQMFN